MEPEQKSNGALVGSVIIIIILILGGIYLLKTSIKEKPLPGNTETAQSNEILNGAAVIEAELDSMDLESLDSEI